MRDKDDIVTRARKRLARLLLASKSERDDIRRKEAGIAPGVAITTSGVPADPDEFQRWSIRRHADAQATRLIISNKSTRRLSDDLSKLSEHLTTLELRHTDIQDIGPISHLANLEDLTILASPIADFSPLAELPNLQRLQLGGVPPEALATLPDLPNLKELRIPFGPTNTLPPDIALPQLECLKLGTYPGHHILRNKPHLRQLDLPDIGDDLSPLQNLTELEHLKLRTTAKSLEPLAGLSRLRRLELIAEEALSIAPLGHLSQLTHLHISAPNINDFTALSSLTNLETVIAPNSAPLQDVAWVTGCTALSDARVSVGENTDLSPLASTSIRNLFLRLHGHTSLDVLSQLPHVEQLTLNGDNVEAELLLPPLPDTLAHLALAGSGFANLPETMNCPQLKRVSLQNTRIRDLTPLRGLPHLSEISLTGCPITSLDVLKTLPAFLQDPQRQSALYIDDCPILDRYPHLKPLARGTKQREGYIAANDLARAVIAL